MTAQALTAAPDPHDAPFLRWLADSVADANPKPPDKPPPPRRTRREAHQLVIGGLNALAYAAQNERVRLSALYALGRIHGFEYIADRILDLAVSTASETVQLAALNVAARGLGILAPLRSRLDPEKPFEPPAAVTRLFPGDEDQLDQLNRPPDPDDPPDGDSPPIFEPIPDFILDMAAAAPPEPMPGFATKADPQSDPQTPPPDRPRKPADHGPNPIRLTPRNPLPRLPAYPSLPQLPAGRPDPAHNETPNETPGETPEPNDDQPPPEPGDPPPGETRQTRENTIPPQPPPTDLPRPPP